MKRWPLVVICIIWIGLGVLLNWVYGAGGHGAEHEPVAGARAEETASNH